MSTEARCGLYEEHVADVQLTSMWDTGNVKSVPTPNQYLTPEQSEERSRRRQRFGARLRHLREDAGMTQEQVALAAGIDRPFLVQIEGGKRSLLVERLDDIAVALGVTAADLLTDER